MAFYSKWAYGRVELEIMGIVVDVRYVRGSECEKTIELFKAVGKSQPYEWVVYIKRHIGNKTLRQRKYRRKLIKINKQKYMKTKWISINDKMPILNEIIYYNGSPNGQRGRNTGNGFVKLPNGSIDQFTQWKPKIQGKVTFGIFHIDGVTRIEADGVVDDGNFIAEYNYKGMCYGATIPLSRIK